MPGQLTGGQRSGPKPATDDEQRRAGRAVTDAYLRKVAAVPDRAAVAELLDILGIRGAGEQS